MLASARGSGGTRFLSFEWPDDLLDEAMVLGAREGGKEERGVLAVVEEGKEFGPSLAAWLAPRRVRSALPGTCRHRHCAEDSESESESETHRALEGGATVVLLESLCGVL